jgi:hypothetical protein
MLLVFKYKNHCLPLGTAMSVPRSWVSRTTLGLLLRRNLQPLRNVPPVRNVDDERDCVKKTDEFLVLLLRHNVL